MKPAVQSHRSIRFRTHEALATPTGKLCVATAVIMLFSFGIMALPLVAASNPQAYYQGLMVLLAPLSTLSFCMSLFSLYLTITHLRGHGRDIPGDVLDVSAPIAAPSEMPSENNGSEQCFQQAVFTAAQQFNLTKRETEVFGLLMQGRNAERISKALVISKHTSKSHIYRIYRKTATSSQQDLLDLFECEFQNGAKGIGRARSA